MLITDSFVWINFPKTGSTFARESLKKLYRIPWWDLAKKSRMRGRWCQEALVPEMRPGVGNRHGRLTPHGVVSQIPAEEVGKPVVSCLRNPCERLLSLYAYGDWRKTDQLPRPEALIVADFPGFPELTFEQFVDYFHKEYGDSVIKVGREHVQVGPQSADFLRFFTNQEAGHGSFLSYESWEALEHELGKIIFIPQGKLSEDLPRLLERFGHSKQDVDFIRCKPRSNSSSQRVLLTGLPKALRKNVSNYEWLLDAAHAGIEARGCVYAGCLKTRQASLRKANSALDK